MKRSDEAETRSRWFNLSDTQQKELREMRKRHRTENKQKKILKTDSEGVRVHCTLYCNFIAIGYSVRE